MTIEQLHQLVRARAHATAGTGRAIREGVRLSAAEVADAIGVSEAAISRWERGLRQPRGDAAIRWVALLDELVAHSDDIGTAQPMP